VLVNYEYNFQLYAFLKLRYKYDKLQV